MAKDFPIFVGGNWTTSANTLSVTNPFNDEVVGTTYLATKDQLDQAIKAAQEIFPSLRSMATYDRACLLQSFAAKMRERRDDVAHMICLEAGKPIREAEVEADRGVFTIETAAEEAKRIEGEVMPLDLLPSSKGRFGIVRRFPIGPIAGISPFNFPLNLALHKVAPALAAGNPIVLKPPSRDPLTMLLVAKMLDEIGVPKGAVSVVPMDREVGDILVEDDRFKLLSFTGSPDVGWEMKRRAGMKRVVLELGGNAGVVIDDDSDIEFAAQRVKTGAFAYAGQVCISVQRVFIHETVYDEFKDRLIAETTTVNAGDPLDRATDLGPMIDDKAAKRTEQWVADAVAQGANVVVGGNADGRFFQPTVIENAPRDAFVCSREAFAPLVTIFKVPNFKCGVDALNDSEYGLQAGVFTNKLEHALYSFERIETGAVIINDVPTYRIDHMPYGGVKASGLSREGLRYAIEDMTEMRLLVVNRLDSQRVTS
ncbi:MAG: aldehyde dehydrogenase family protein [Thermomicrobiales bacterium]